MRTLRMALAGMVGSLMVGVSPLGVTAQTNGDEPAGATSDPLARWRSSQTAVVEAIAVGVDDQSAAADVDEEALDRAIGAGSLSSHAAGLASSWAA